METKSNSLTILTKPSGTTLLILLIGLLIGGIFLSGVFYPSKAQLIPQLLMIVGVSAALSAGNGFLIIPLLQKLKAGQIIREDGPSEHLKKAGTPTMGGIFFIPVAAILAIALSQFNTTVIVLALLTLAYGLIGFIDDWQILLKKSNKGISPKTKLTLQILAGAIFCFWLYFNAPQQITNINLPGRIILPLGLLFWPFAVFVLTAESNATNLTDGVDGLAAGVSAIAFLTLAIVVAPNYPEMMIFSACLSGACLGFVVHNRNPALVFMGDTGSLALGGAFAGVGIVTNHLWSVFIVSGIFFAESLSVIAQVSYYKATKGPDGLGKRLFKMAPLHHHLELSGYSETQIVGLFYLISFFLGVLALTF